MKAEELE